MPRTAPHRVIRRWVGLLILGAGTAILFVGPSSAAERELEQAPPPSSTDEINVPTERVLVPEAYEKPIFPWFGKQLQKLPRFSPIGVSGLSAIVNFVHGWDGRLLELDVRRDAREVDVTVDYKLPKELGLYEGLWLRVRGSWLRDDAFDRDGTDFRVILRYDFPVL